MEIDQSQFSEREKEVISLLLQGMSNKQIALALEISQSTVEYHLKNIYRKLQVTSRTEAVLRLGKSMSDETAGDSLESTIAAESQDAGREARPNSVPKTSVNKLYTGIRVLLTITVVVFLGSIEQFKFNGHPAVFATDAGASRRSIYAITSDGRLAQVWDEGGWQLDFPAEKARRGELRFQGTPAVFPTNAATNKKSIYAITTEGRLAQVWDNGGWHLDFPSETAGQGGLRFQGTPAVFPTNAAANKKSIYAITSDGRLAQVWDDGGWQLNFPAEQAGHPELRFQNGVAVFPTDAAANKKSIYAITIEGRLAQVWDDGGWHLDFPAEKAGYSELRFQNGVAVFPINAAANKKSIYAITSDGRLAQMSGDGGWQLDFPAEEAGWEGLRFQGIPAVFATDAAANKKSIYAITTEGRLAQVWDEGGWQLDFPAEQAGQGGLRFQGTPAVFPINAAANKKSIYAITTEGRLAQVWDNGGWHLDFPAERARQGAKISVHTRRLPVHVRERFSRTV